jgi:hypothetical protein
MSSVETVSPLVYEPPALQWAGETAEAVSWVWWAVVVGFSFALALAYAAYCSRLGGSPSISFGWKGFTVTCHR